MTHPLTQHETHADLITDPDGDMAVFHWPDGGSEAYCRFEGRLLCEVEP